MFVAECYNAQKIEIQKWVDAGKAISPHAASLVVGQSNLATTNHTYEVN